MRKRRSQPSRSCRSIPTKTRQDDAPDYREIAAQLDRKKMHQTGGGERGRFADGGASQTWCPKASVLEWSHDHGREMRDRMSSMGMLFGLIAALGWGTGDFFTRYSTHRIGTYRTMFYMQFLGIVGLGAYILLTGEL